MIRPVTFAMLIALATVIPVSAEDSGDTPRADIPPILSTIIADIDEALEDMDAALLAASETVADGGVPEMPGDWPFVAGVWSAGGETGMFGRVELLDRIDAPLSPLHRTDRALLRRFAMRDGVPTFALQRPVLDAEGANIGAVAFLFPSDEFLANRIEPAVEGFPVDAWSMLPTGQIIYDPDTQEVGRNVFTDPLYKPYPELIDLSERIAMTGEGDGLYQFLATGFDEVVMKRAHWGTAGIHNMQWRIVLVQVVEGNPLLVYRNFSDMEALYLRNRLREVAQGEPMIRAIAQGNAESVHGILHAFVAENPMVYSVQWVDADGIIRFGWPEANSLKDYDLAKNQIEGDDEFLRQLQAGNEHWQVRPLAEGGIGLMFLAPLPDGGGLLLIRLIDKDQ